mmetsp:Transcript_107547/g.304037  ORF Transcript_107547/g.304037 Transcript_107547/m.304037 type:complete len:229 (-) Transcript_107547:50-736(-)
MHGDDHEEGVRAQGLGECDGESWPNDSGMSVETLEDKLSKLMPIGETYSGWSSSLARPDQANGVVTSGRRRKSEMRSARLAFCAWFRDGDREGVRSTRSGDAAPERAQGWGEPPRTGQAGSPGGASGAPEISVAAGHTYSGSPSRTGLWLGHFAGKGRCGHRICIRLSVYCIDEVMDSQLFCDMSPVDPSVMSRPAARAAAAACSFAPAGDECGHGAASLGPGGDRDA